MPGGQKLMLIPRLIFFQSCVPGTKSWLENLHLSHLQTRKSGSDSEHYQVWGRGSSTDGQLTSGGRSDFAKFPTAGVWPGIMGRCGEEHLAPEEETLEDRWKLGAISVIICDPSPPGQAGPLQWQKSHSSARFTLIITLADTWSGFVSIRGTNWNTFQDIDETAIFQCHICCLIV